MGLEMNSDHRPRLILWDFVTVWRRLPLKAIRRAMPMIAKEAGAEDGIVSIEWTPGRRERVEVAYRQSRASGRWLNSRVSRSIHGR